VYLTELTVRNAKLLRNLTLDFTRGRQPRPWTVLVGENGLCKTTLLQAIALVASGPTRANQLVPDAVSMRDRRRPDEPVNVSANFVFGSGTHPWRDYPGLDPRPDAPPGLSSTIELTPGRKEFDGSSSYALSGDFVMSDPVVASRARDLPLWFVAGYGVSRRLPFATVSRAPSVLSLARLEPLFDRAEVLGTAFADLFEPDLAGHYVRSLRDVLITGGLLPEITQLELRGRGGVRSSADLVDAHRFAQRLGLEDVKLPAVWLSHGYQATIAWIADLVGQVLMEANAPTAGQGRPELALVEPEWMEGLVLIDEIDLHLHPRWQVRLVPALKAVFPRVQFVATTHSPMILPGLERDEVIVLDRDADGNVVALPPGQSPALMTGSQMFEAFFGLDRLYPQELGEAVRRLGYLVGDPDRTDDEDEEMRRLRQRLQAAGIDPGWEPVARKPIEKEVVSGEPGTQP
jgi:hypothetical protein